MTQLKKQPRRPAASLWNISGAIFLPLTLIGLLLAATAETVRACGGCFRLPYQSLLEKVESGDRAVVAHATGSSWRIDRVIKGVRLGDGETIAAEKLGVNAKVSADGPQILIWNRVFDTWTSEAPANQELVDFLSSGVTLSAKPGVRTPIRHQSSQLRFFLPYLEHRDVNIADSTHAKLNGAPYAVLQELADDLDPDQLLTWIKDQPATNTKRVALSVVLLGICGKQRDVDLVRVWIDECSGGGESAYLAALLTAHVEMGGEQAVRFLESSYIRNFDRTLGEVIAAIDALRTHGQASTTVSRDRIKASFHLLLRERATLAETIIEDFACWEDWSIAPRLMEIYSGGKQPWNNAMIIKYLKACPQPNAKQFLQRLESDG